ncbi:hypothetical protein MPC4_70033 [Methylocella tundrae]|uniref:Uncharacterized protein n=1 Tax=Methylocella tundrae TaxID=227605 RepID=A0A8B6MD44_METTU|nr:hypothetical protein MPC4_70033 [Methylocella tundrae]
MPGAFRAGHRSGLKLSCGGGAPAANLHLFLCSCREAQAPVGALMGVVLFGAFVAIFAHDRWRRGQHLANCSTACAAASSTRAMKPQC